MKILKHGNPERLKKIVIFTCKHCGCVFEADKTEYKYSSFRNEESYQIECPECGNAVYDGKEKEYEETPNDNFIPVYGVTPVHSVIDLAGQDSFLKNMSPEEMESCLNTY